MKWHIVNTDNFGRDYPNETFTCKDFTNEGDARMCAVALNGDPNAWSSRFYKVVEDGYVLKPGFEP